MAFIKDLGQMEKTHELVSDGSKAVVKKKFMKVRLPLSMLGDKMPKLGDMVVAVTVGPIKGFENTEFSKEFTIEAVSGGIYMKTANLESQIAKAFGKKNTSHNSSHEDE